MWVLLRSRTDQITCSMVTLQNFTSTKLSEASAAHRLRYLGTCIEWTLGISGPRWNTISHRRRIKRGWVWLKISRILQKHEVWKDHSGENWWILNCRTHCFLSDLCLVFKKQKKERCRHCGLLQSVRDVQNTAFQWFNLQHRTSR